MNEFLNPEALARPKGFAHVCRSSAPLTLYVSGQVAYDSHGQVVGVGDLRVQTAKVYSNIATALRSAGASMGDVVKTTLYVRDLDPEKAAVIREVRARYFPAGHEPTSTMVGVASLARPELLLEVEAVAMREAVLT